MMRWNLPKIKMPQSSHSAALSVFAVSGMMILTLGGGELATT
jgi:hypothetical protein